MTKEPDDRIMRPEISQEGVEQILQLHAEQVAVSKRRSKTLVRATVRTVARDQVVEADLAQERVEVERVPIGRVIDAVPPIREEGDTVVVPVCEEIVVTERRLILREEVRLRRVRTTERHVETVTVREQNLVVTRTPERDADAGSG